MLKLQCNAFKHSRPIVGNINNISSLFVPRSDSIPMNLKKDTQSLITTGKKTLINYIYNASDKDSNYCRLQPHGRGFG